MQLPACALGGALAALPPPQIQHKIQSSAGPLHLDLQPVPKVLGLLKAEWTPASFVVSFKVRPILGAWMR